MSKATNKKTATPAKSSNPMLTGIMLGMIVGVALAAGLAWFIMKSPSPFVNPEPTTKSPSEVLTPTVETIRPAPQHAPETVKPETAKTSVEAANAEAASGVEETKPRFEFYKVLTDKQDTTVNTPEKSKTVENKPAPAKTLYLQAGSFSNESDAESLKATLAMKGIEASIQKVTVPEKGVMHRIRVGPFQNEKEMNNVRATLKLNGLEATPTH